MPVLALVSPLGARGLASQASQPLRWQACQDETLASSGYECATFSRPLRRAEPDGPQVELAVFRLPATGSAKERIGTLFFNPGGPGQPGGSSAYKGRLLPEEVRRAFDFVIWDPRGLGQSRPVLADCSVAMPQRPATGPVDWQRVLKQRQEELAKSNRDCIARHSDLIPQMGTVDAAHDLDALRQAVGDDRLSFWGISYGTVIGSTYAALFPGSVRALVLDGNVDPWIDLGGLRQSATAPDDAIRFFLQLHPDLKRPLQRSLARLTQEPLTLPDGSPYTRWDLLDPLINYIHISRVSGTYGRTLIETVHQALFGAPAEQTAALTTLEHPLLRSPSRDGNAAAGFAAVTCQDFPQRPSPQQQAAWLEDLTRQAPLYGGSLGVNFLALCSGYEDLQASTPVPRAPFPERRVSGLITGASWDAATPWAWSTAMARAFPSMRTLQVVGNEHGIYTNAQSPCVEAAVSRYLLTGRVPTTDLSCRYVRPTQQQAFP
jgi:pimeloyl-ACP methyl ester carboxylesterase